MRNRIEVEQLGEREVWLVYRPVNSLKLVNAAIGGDLWDRVLDRVHEPVVLAGLYGGTRDTLRDALSGFERKRRAGRTR